MYGTMMKDSSIVCKYEDRGIKHLYECHHGCNDIVTSSIR